MTQLWRIHTRPASEEGIDATRFCIDNSVVGVGWAVDAESDITDWSQYEKLVKEQQSEWIKDNSFMPAMNALIDYMEVDDLIWTRSRDGIYYLGKCIGEWRCTCKPEYKQADIVNIRTCSWKEIGVETNVPGKVINSFRPSRTLQRINDDSSLGYSQLLLSEPISVEISDIFSLLSAEDLEDIVGLYLQHKYNYHLIPSSRSRRNDTIKYEFILIDEHGKEAAVQVKSGNESINLNDYIRLAEKLKVFIFCASGDYAGHDTANIEAILPDSIKDFMNSHECMLPERIRRWKQYLMTI